jgi:hypothetical protein
MDSQHKELKAMTNAILEQMKNGLGVPKACLEKTQARNHGKPKLSLTYTK